MINEIKELAKKSNFCFYVDEQGEPTLTKYGQNKINPEVYVEQRISCPHRSAVFIERMSDTHPHLNKTLEFVIKINDKLKIARLRLDNNPEITVQDFIKQNQTKEGIPEFLYHGTSAKSARKILENGLQPREMTNQPAKYQTARSGESLKDRVYLCTFGNVGSAKCASRMAASFDESKPVILKISTQGLKRELMMPDEDSRMATWESSLNSLGALSYKGIIEENKISIAEDLTVHINNGITLDECISKKNTTDNKIGKSLKL
jgi:hypothetical protein